MTSPSEVPTASPNATTSAGKGENTEGKQQACAYLDTELAAYAERVKEDLLAAQQALDISAMMQTQREMFSEYESIGKNVENAERPPKRGHAFRFAPRRLLEGQFASWTAPATKLGCRRVVALMRGN